CHCTAPDHGSTDWERILRHYDALIRIKPSPIVALNRAVAVANVSGPDEGLKALDEIHPRERIESHYLFHAVHGGLHWRRQNHRAGAQRFLRAWQLANIGPEQISPSQLRLRAESAPWARAPLPRR